MAQESSTFGKPGPTPAGDGGSHPGKAFPRCTVFGVKSSITAWPIVDTVLQVGSTTTVGRGIAQGRNHTGGLSGQSM